MRVLFFMDYFGGMGGSCVEENVTMWGAEMVASWPIDLIVSHSGGQGQGSLPIVHDRFSEGNSLGRVFVCVPLVEDVVCTVYECHRLGGMER